MPNGLYDIVMHVEFLDTSPIRHIFGGSQHYAWYIDECVTPSEWKKYKREWFSASLREKKAYVTKQFDDEMSKLDVLFDTLDPSLEICQDQKVQPASVENSAAPLK